VHRKVRRLSVRPTRRLCESSSAYETAALADRAAVERSRLTGHPSRRVYRCQRCGLWHVVGDRIVTRRQQERR
jgi:hypothetical protein